MKSRYLGLMAVSAVLVGFVLPVLCQDVKEYKVAKVSKTAPVIDGKFTEEEWAGSAWADEFYGADLDPNLPEYKAGRIDSVMNIKWRALWDEDYLYILLTTDMKFLTPNGGVTYDGVNLFDPILADDGNVGDWGNGCDDFEFFFVPKWTEDLGNVGEAAGSGPAGYQFCYFPVAKGEDINGTGDATPSNFGVRGEAGPPFFYSGYSGDGNYRPGPLAWIQVADYTITNVTSDWAPIFGTAPAQAAGVKPMQFASTANEVAGAADGDVVAKPVIEYAFPFSQFSYTNCILTITTTDENTGETAVNARTAVADDIPDGGTNVILTKDAQGHWVKVNDQWLFNITGYADGWFAANGLTYITWNPMQSGGFHNWPKGKLIFTAAVGVDSWMLY